MEAKDLRIGNWFLGDCTEGKFHQITAKEILDFYDDPQDDYYQPIPLTEEWLLKFRYRKTSPTKIGCRYDCGHGIVRVIKYNERIRQYRNWSNVDRLNGFSWGKTRIDYVHQLQNLYFALTGEELTLNN